MDKNVEISLLLDIYGSLLTDRQFKMLDDYYNNDLSLSEIAENEGITRQAVRDNLMKSEKKIYEFESNLQVMKKRLDQDEKIYSLIESIKKMKDSKLDKIVDKLEELVNIKLD